MFRYRGHLVEIDVFFSDASATPQRIKRYKANVEMNTVNASSEEELFDKIDTVMGPPRPEEFR